MWFGYSLFVLILFTFITRIVSYPFSVSPRTRGILFGFIKATCVSIYFLTGNIPRVKGLENIKKNTTYLICSNHTSYLDIIVLYTILPMYLIFVGKVELRTFFLTSSFFNHLNIPLDRSGTRQTILDMKRIHDRLRSGVSVVMFPEGNISKNVPELGRFKEGAFRLASKAKVDILPITLLDNWKRMPDFRQKKRRMEGRPGLNRVVIHPPISYENKSDAELSKEVEASIKSTLTKAYPRVEAE